MQLLKKQKAFSEFFFAFLKLLLSFIHFPKKLTLIADVFPKLTAPKTWLDNCLKSHDLGEPSTGNMGNGLKQCWNLNDSIFTIFINHCEGNCVGKSQFY